MSIDELLKSLQPTPTVPLEQRTDQIFQLVDGMQERGEFAELDAILGGLDVWKMSLANVRSWLVITAASADKTPSRDGFIERAWTAFHRHPKRERLLGPFREPSGNSG